MSKTKAIRADVKNYEVFPVGKTPVRLTLSFQTVEGGIDLHVDEATAIGIAADILDAIRTASR